MKANYLVLAATALATGIATVAGASAAPITKTDAAQAKTGNGNANGNNTGAGGGGQTGGGQTSTCSVSEVSLTIGSTTYRPTSCAIGVDNGGENAETGSIAAALGLAGQGFVYLDKTDDTGAAPTGLGGVEFTALWTGGGVGGAVGTWSVAWADVDGSPNLPLVVDFGVGLFGGNGPDANGTAYLFSGVLLPVSPNTGSGTFDINFTNNGGNQPTLSHLTLIGGNPAAPPPPPPTTVPEPASLALFGAGLLGLGLVRRRRRAEPRGAG